MTNSNNCVSYETLVGALTEISQSKKVDPMARHFASDTVYVLKNHPKTAQLVQEGLSNSTCTDLAQITQAFSEGVRNIAIAQSALKIGRDVPYTLEELSKAAGEVGKATREISGTAKATTETVGYAGREIGSIYGRFDKAIKDGVYVGGFLIPILLIAAGAVYGRKLLDRFTSRTHN